MPAKQQTTVALSKEARAMVDKALIKRGESMAGYTKGGPAERAPNKDSASTPDSGFLDSFMRRAGAAAEGQATSDMRIAFDMFMAPSELASRRG